MQVIKIAFIFFTIYFSSYLLKAQYCTPTYELSCSNDTTWLDSINYSVTYYGHFIDDFTLNSINLLDTRCNNQPDNYINTDTVTTLTKGNYYSFSVGSWFGNTGFGIWIDFNQDGDFEDSLEFVYGSPTADIYFSGSIYIPQIALTDTTRIRVRCKVGDVISASQSCSYFLDRGETEDYIAIIKEPAKPPSSKFITDKKISCNGFVQFTDLSSNLPDTWYWDFGDGSSDIVQNPLHFYKQDSTYDITLITSNQFGSDTIMMDNYILTSMADTMMCRMCGEEHFKSYEYECDSLEQIAHMPDDSTEIKTYYLHFLVVRDDSGQGNGNITQDIIDSLVIMTNKIFEPWKMQFCSYSTDFINDSRFVYIGNADTLMEFRSIYGKYQNDQINVAITDYSLLGLSGNPLLLDYTVVQYYNTTGAEVLAHEIGHNFQLGHVNTLGNLMYPSMGGSGITLDSLQVGNMHCFAETKNPLYTWYQSWLTFGNKVCNNYGLPYGRFYAENTGGCSPLTVNFLDISSFNPTNWYWDFGDGTYDTVENPVHIYTKSGRYSVKMIVSNTFGSDTVIKNDFVNVKDSVYGLPVLENFEDSLFPPADWHIYNSDQQIGWKRNTFAHGNSGSGYYNKGSVSMEAWPGNFYDTNDVLITANYDFRYAINPFIAYDISYPKDSWDDGLIIWANSNCGDSLQRLHVYGSPFNYMNSSMCVFVFDSTVCAINGIGLYDIIDTLGTYLIDTYISPLQFTACESEHWRRDTIWLKSLEGEPNVSFKFKFISHYNKNENLYLDDILISAEKISGLPVANFTADTTTIYKNDTIHFTNLSNKYSDTLQWFFTGATIATTQDTNPSIVYDSAGIFPVTLVVWNLFGRDTLTKLAYINVLQKIDTIPCDSMQIILSKNDINCKGKNDGTVTASAFNGNSDYSFSWSTGSTLKTITGLAEGIYTVTVTDSIGCTKTDSVKISYTDTLPVAGFTYSDTIVKIYFTNLSTNADFYLWNFGDDSTDNSSNPTHIYSDFGTYEACLIAMNNCGADTLCKSISIVDGIKENTGEINLQIFPNPNSGTFTIIIEQPQTNEIQITLTNILGQKIYTNKITTKIFKEELNLSNYSKGIYSLKLVTNNASVSRKVVYR